MLSLITIKVGKDFKEGLHPNLAIDSVKIKYFSETHFSQTLMIFTCFFIDSSDVYKLIEFLSQPLDFAGNWL